jgi:nucleoside-diphosphate-sugar epimerase
VILITGATGKIGIELSKKLVDAFHVVGLDLLRSSFATGVDLIGVDISSEKKT